MFKIDGHEPVRVDLAALRPDTAHKVWLDFVHTKDQTDLEFQVTIYPKSKSTRANIFKEAMERKSAPVVDLFNEEKDN